MRRAPNNCGYCIVSGEIREKTGKQIHPIFGLLNDRKLIVFRIRSTITYWSWIFSVSFLSISSELEASLVKRLETQFEEALLNVNDFEISKRDNKY